MKYTVKFLNLYKDLCYGGKIPRSKTPAAEKTADTQIDTANMLYRYTCAVAPKDLYPCRSRFLTDPKFEGYAITGVFAQSTHAGKIPAGRYLFLQSLMPEACRYTEDTTAGQKNTAIKQRRLTEYRLAAEYLHTEALWNEAEFSDNTIYIRTLKEDGKEVFQLFRRIKNNGSGS